MGGIRMAVAVTLLTGALLAVSDAATALAAPTLISGRVVAPAGVSAASASGGTATVFLDSSDSGAMSGSFHRVGAARLRGGRFRVPATTDPAVARVAKGSEGWANFLLMVRTPAGESLYPFSRRLGDARGVSISGSAGSARVELFPYLAGGRPTDASLSSSSRADCDWKRSRTYYRYTRVGQLHQWNGFSSSFGYATGGSADSNIGGAIERGGTWSFGATVHVTQTKDQEKGEIFHPNRRRFSRYLMTRFTYYYYYLKGKDCTQRMKVLRPGWHVGGSYYKRYNDAAEVLDGHCNSARGQQKLIIAARSTEYTSGGEASSISRGVSLLGVTLGSQSGWSKHVKSTWRNITNQHRAICSVEGDPNTAPITYVGGVIRG
jgi:hypothetical protein